MGCRCPEIERMIISKRQAHGTAAKQIVLILNKIDLVPPSVVAAWVKFFRREYPTLAFKSATSRGSSSRLAQSVVPTEHATSDTLALTPAVGAQGLLQLLKNYARQAGMKKKKKITVGVSNHKHIYISYHHIMNTSMMITVSRSSDI
jgi:nuclear GTP-binding protein